jgi:hypothetical protein
LVTQEPTDFSDKKHAKKRKEKKEKRKSVKEETKKPKEKRQRAKEIGSAKNANEDPKVTEQRNELKLLILNQAERTQMTQPELKKELAKAARIKENDLGFELEKMRLKHADSWSKGLAASVKNGTGLFLDKVLKGNGHIAQEMMEDKNLEHALHSQLEKIAFLMDPRIRIGLLTVQDVVQGYAKKMREQASIPPPPQLIRQDGVHPGV